MKNIVFPHSVSSRHTFMKRLISVLLAFIAGLACVHAAAVPLSSSDTDTAVSIPKGTTTSTNLHMVRLVPDKKTAVRTAADWQKRKPFMHGDTPASGKRTPNKTPSRHLPSALLTANGTDKNTLRLAAARAEPAYDLAQDQMSKPTEPDTGNEGYTIGPARFTIDYEKTNDRDHEQTASLLTGDTVCSISCSDMIETHTDRDKLRFGMEYTAGNGRINASLDIIRIKTPKKNDSDNPDATDLKTLSIGYTYDMSDSTSFYGAIARTEYDKEAITGDGNGAGDDSVIGLRVGITHKF